VEHFCRQFHRLNTMSEQNSVRQMTRQQEILRQVTLLSAIGVGLFGVALFAPDARPHLGAFYQPALETSWGNLLNMPAVWASLKIMLFFIGLFLVIESAGTVLALLKMKSLSVIVYFLQVVPCLGLVCGSYYLVKAVL
jgi:hypothetical protein